MPVVQQQKNKPAPAKPFHKQTILDRIIDVGDIKSGHKFVVYGKGKTGKTRFACTFPKPLLIIGTEDGRKSVSSVPGVKFARLLHTDEIKEHLMPLFRRDAFRTVFLDHVTGFQDLRLKEILGLDEVPQDKNWGMAQMDQWMACGQQVNRILADLFALADSHAVNVICSAHERDFRKEGSTSDLIVPTIGPALTPASATWLNGAADYVCQTFIREGEKVEMVKGVGGKEVKRVTKEMQYCLRTGAHPVYQSGFRVPLGTPLPEFIVNPTYEKVDALIRGVKK